MSNNDNPGCLGILLKLFGGGGDGGNADFPYVKRDYLLTKAELNFYHCLRQIVGDDYTLFAKVRLADLIKVKPGTEKRQSFFNRISAKHVDFVIATNSPVKPVLVIELDDASHNTQSRKARDVFVDQALDAAGIPILHVPAQKSYNLHELTEAIEAKMNQEPAE